MSAPDSLARMPNRSTAVSYARDLMISKSERPVIRGYSMRAFHLDGPRGSAVLAAAEALPAPDNSCGWTVGESGLAVAVRGHWVRSGPPKDRTMFCGYWKATRAH
ncbi:SIP domain-containing protein [Actinokineospora sp. NBRC 105648]|uniref:SIP domain-containing protein n=1 Tax=Actinokineospora sp. NBRC 105648 TaxID=3032206 RepID=UPI0024A5940B|nr:SIP domain-containing protein [Actinokineospora sp. NBRC 105648]GLZ40747.1 hypothetical protein Acsp05_43710 [Actinokineospora sp. NBRC 105648]